MTAVMETEELAVGYRHGRREQVVLDGLSLRLESGELTCLLGANGSGKSTLLRTIAGMQPPLSGAARLLGDDVTRLPAMERARRVAVVLTDRIDAGIMRSRDLVALGRYPHTGWSGRLGEADVAAVRWALQATGADRLADRNVAELSDGERQRVLLARALAQLDPHPPGLASHAPPARTRPGPHPPGLASHTPPARTRALLALDEPVAFVDVARRVELTGLLRDLARECDLAVLLTSHDLELALRAADRVWLIDDRTVHVGAPEDLVLSGTVEHAFASEGATFDPARGTFSARVTALATVRVIGPGTAAAWTTRALAREGYAAVDAPEPADVEVTVADGQWLLRGPGGTTRHASVGALSAAARRILPTLVAGTVLHE